MVDTRWLYTGLLLLMAIARLAELGLAGRNQRWLAERGAVEVGSGHYPVMVVQHALFLMSCLVEVWCLDRPFLPPLAAVMMVLLVLAMGLRYWVIATLGRRWTTRVYCLSGEPTITHGPYRYLRHPNYLAVVIEIFALPLIHTAWLTAMIFSVTNGMVLRHRIRVEEAALSRYGDYETAFADRSSEEARIR
jgi:methyltransferase